jgi:hypothetical protein
MAAGEIDFAGYALTNPGLVFRLGHFTDEFMAWRAGKTIVSALEFEISGTDSGRQQADARESLGNARQTLFPNFHASGFEVNGKHVV